MFVYQESHEEEARLFCSNSLRGRHLLMRRSHSCCRGGPGLRLLGLRLRSGRAQRGFLQLLRRLGPERPLRIAGCLRSTACEHSRSSGQACCPERCRLDA